MAELKKALPGQWGARLEVLGIVHDRVPIWLRAQAWLDQVQDFKKLHGDVLDWNMSDTQIVDKAAKVAAWVDQVLELKGPGACDAEKVDKVCALCDIVGVEYPRALTAGGVVARATDETWWRRSLRRKVARVVEFGSIKLGIVNRREGGYCSGDAVARRRGQLARNAAALEATLIRNEAGQVFKLSELAARSTANPEIRGGELMVRIRGCEDFADRAGHVGYFLTLTCPSKFHAIQSGGRSPRAKPRPNPRFDGISTPRDAQLWLRSAWARVRAAWARAGVSGYGFRVAEPHHDGCPHWHSLIWFESQHQAVKALQIVGRYWLADGGPVVGVPLMDGGMMYKGAAGSSHEPGALKNRVNIKRMIKGGAAGYVAKYVAKSIGHVDVGVQLDQQDGKAWEVDTREVKGWMRVDAWAATWGIRQFQAIGQPSVTVWRELRRVTSDQIERAQLQGDKAAVVAWYAAQKIGNVGADWCRYMVAMGGACLKRAAYALTTGVRENPKVNGYGELVTERKTVGVETRQGRLLVSRRQEWARVGQDVGIQDSAEREALGAPWTRFNNCTARLTHMGRAALLGLKNFTEGGPVYALAIPRRI